MTMRASVYCVLICPSLYYIILTQSRNCKATGSHARAVADRSKGPQLHGLCGLSSAQMPRATAHGWIPPSDSDTMQAWALGTF